MTDLATLRRPYEDAAPPTAAAIATARAELVAAQSGRGRRRRTVALTGGRLVGGAASAAIAAVLIAIFVAVPRLGGDDAPTGSTGPISTPAELLAALSVASFTDLPSLREGEFYYSEGVSLGTGSQRRTMPVTSKGLRFTIVNDEPTVQQTWNRPGGQTRSRTVPSEAWQPLTAGDRARWIEAGRPELTRLWKAAAGEPGVDYTGRGTGNTAQAYGMNHGPVDLSAFVGKPDDLAAALRRGFEGSGPNPNTEMFVITNDILRELPSLPGALRRTVLEVMLTKVDGIQVTPSSTDLLGRTGVLVELDTPGNGRQGVIIDPVTGDVLGERQSFTGNTETFTLDSAATAPIVVPAIDRLPDGTTLPVG